MITDCTNNTSTEILIRTASFTIPAVIAIIAVILTYLYAVKKLNKESPVLLMREIYSRKLNALEGLWTFLEYTTETDNGKSILYYVKIDQKISWYIRKKNAKEFLDGLPKYFYESGKGIYLSKVLKESIFKYRNIIYGFLLKTSDSKEEDVKIENDEMRKTLVELHQQLSNQIHKEINTLPAKIEIEKLEY